MATVFEERPTSLEDDLRVGRHATIETMEGRFIAGVVERLYQTTQGIPICLVVGGATVPWSAIRAVRDDPAVQADPGEMFVPLDPGTGG